MNGSVSDILRTIHEIKEIKMVSVDIFDTLLFRMTHNPEEVFELTAERAREEGILPKYLSNEEYRNIRICSEKKARAANKEKLHSAEILHAEIFHYFPTMFSDKQLSALRDLEWEMEQSICYINPLMAETLNKIKQMGLELCLTSDMYFTGEQLMHILGTSDFPVKLIKDIYVSCEYGFSKETGELYHTVLKEQGLLPHQLLHIGDNYQSDIIRAKKIGIHTYYYQIKNPSAGMKYEDLIYPGILPEINSLRKEAGISERETKEERFFYRMGAEIYGPFLTGMTEWILDMAQQEGISTIYPLMREGRILGRLLERAIQFRNSRIQVKELFISRKAVCLPSIRESVPYDFEPLVNAPHIDLHRIFQTLGMEKQEESFRRLCGDFETIEPYPLMEALNKFFEDGERKREWSSLLKEKTEYAFGYFKQMGMQQRCMTVDIGFHGTIQSGIEKILRKQGIENKNIHILGFGVKTIIDKIMDNIDIRGYVGSFGRNEDINTFVMFHHRLLEQALMCEEGSTVGYRCRDGQYFPILQEPPEGIKKQWRTIQNLQEGILSYQNQFLSLSLKKKKIRAVITKPEELAAPYLRLIKNPTGEEAEYLGKLQHDENFGADVLYELCKKEQIDMVKEKGAVHFLHAAEESAWTEGLLTCADETYEFKNLVSSISGRIGQAMAILAKEMLICRETDSVCIIGAGEAGKMLFTLLRLLRIHVEAFIDNNSLLQGEKVEETIVVSMKQPLQSKVFLLGTLAHTDKLVRQAKTQLPKNSKIIYYLDGTARCLTI